MENNTELIFQIARLDALISRKIPLTGVGLSDFVILSHLDRADGKRLKRSELAEKTGLTPSGITRLLLPMEKIGLVGREPHPTDARSSYVTLASGGAYYLEDARDRAERWMAEHLSDMPAEDVERTMAVLSRLAARVA